VKPACLPHHKVLNPGYGRKRSGFNAYPHQGEPSRPYERLSRSEYYPVKKFLMPGPVQRTIGVFTECDEQRGRGRIDHLIVTVPGLLSLLYYASRPGGCSFHFMACESYLSSFCVSDHGAVCWQLRYLYRRLRSIEVVRRSLRNLLTVMHGAL
jgi:hypothetical protein